MRGKRIIVLAIACIWGAGQASSLAHGLIDSTNPQRGARLERQPRRVAVTLTEQPTDARLVVRDGCGNKVSGDSKRQGATVGSIVAGGRPGKWSVRFNAVSSEDGHLSKGGYSFRVMGEVNCDQESAEEEKDEPAETRSDPEPSRDSPRERTAPSDGPDSTGLPAAATLLSLGVLVGAFAVGVALKRRGRA